MPEVPLERDRDFHAFFEAVGDLVVVGGPGGRILHANQALVRRLGYSLEELGQMHVLDLHPVEHRQEATAIFGAMFRRERSSCPLPLATKDGTLVPVETRVWFGRWNGVDCVFGQSKDLSSEQEAHQRFERLFRNNPALMALSALPEGRFSDVNESFLKTLGYDRDDIIGHQVEELGLFVRPDLQQAVSAQLAATGAVAGVELQIRRKDGALIDGLFSGELISSQGKDYFLTVAIDITARKRAEAALRQERQRLASIILATNIGTWEWMVPTGEVVFNERWAEIIGFTLAELAPVSLATWMERAHPDDLRTSGALLERHFRGELAFYECECRMRHRNGAWVWVLDRGCVLSRTAEGKPLLMSGTHQDITARKREEEVVLRHLEEERRLSEAKSQFVSIASHEFRTPLTAAVGNVALLEMYGDRVPPAKRVELLQRTKQSLTRLTAIMDDMLVLSRAESGKIVVQRVETDLGALMQAVVREIAEGDRQQHRFVSESAGEEVKVPVDPSLLEHVLANLLSNAVRYSPQDATIWIRLGIEAGAFMFTVADEGIGVPAAERERIFEPFMRGSNVAHIGGTGLGLNIVKRYVELMGGRIELLPSERGAVFQVRIPRDLAAG